MLVKYLRYLISDQGLLLDPNRIQCLKFPVATDQKTTSRILESGWILWELDTWFLLNSPLSLYVAQSWRTISFKLGRKHLYDSSDPENQTSQTTCFIFKNYLFIYFIFGCSGLSPVAVSRGHSSLRCTGFPFWWLFLLQGTDSRLKAFSGCSLWAQ